MSAGFSVGSTPNFKGTVHFLGFFKILFQFVIDWHRPFLCVQDALELNAA